jgi:hypothetical protein
MSEPESINIKKLCLNNQKKDTENQVPDCILELYYKTER